MDSLALLINARAAGFQLHAEGKRLLVRGPKRLAALAQELLRHKAQILDLLEAWEERASIIQCDGGVSREEAERLAWQCVLGEHAR